MFDLNEKELSEDERTRMAAIPRRTLKDRYLVDKAKRALIQDRCPDCRTALTVVDTWERECATPGCGYTFNWYHWPT